MAKAIYKSNGVEFATELEADRHSTLVEKCQAMEDAMEEVIAALADNCKMADGTLFNVKGHDNSFLGHDYYFIDTKSMDMMPRLRQIDIWAHYLSVEGDNNNVKIRVYSERFKEYETVAISDLYTTKKEAEVALIATCEKWLAEQNDWLTRYKASLSPQG